MAAELSSMRKRKSRGIIAHLSWAACECFLICLLFLEALFSYLLREFAKCCELQVPCPLCSRLDHMLGKMKVGCSWSLVCSSHKEEISSFVLSSVHCKLSDARRNCGECFEPVGCKANVEPPLPYVCGLRHFRHQDGVKKQRNKHRTVPMRHRRTVNNSFGYTKLDGSSSPIGDSYTRGEYDVGLGRRDHRKVLTNDVLSDEQTHQDSEMKDQTGVVDLDELKKVDCSSSDAMKGHASREHRSVDSNQQPNPCSMKEAVSLDSLSQLPNVGSLGASAEPSSLSLSLSSAVSELPHSVPSASINLRITKKSIYIEESAAMNIEAKAESSSDESTYSSNSFIEAVPGSLFQCAESMKLTEEDTKCMSRVSTSGSGLLLKDKDKESKEGEEDCTTQPLPLPLRRNESITESLDGVSFEKDRSCIKSLYEELEEERKAAGVAASQAMTMITRLQEEKAAVEMEAVQYIKMMELRAEHDMESLERANNLLSEKDKELEFFRNNFRDGSGLKDLREESSLLENDAASRSENSPGTSTGSESARFSKANSSVSNFGDEKLYISHSLEKLVKNLYKDYGSEIVKNSANGLDSYEMKDGVGPMEDTVTNFDQNGSYVLKGNTAQYYKSSDASAENHFHNEKNDSMNNSAAFMKESSTLHERFEGLEINREPLMYCSGLLRDGEDGQWT